MAVEHQEVAGPDQQPVPSPTTDFWTANRVSVLAAVAAVVHTAAVWLVLPHERLLTSVWVLLGKLTPFVAATIAIAWLDPGWARRLRVQLWALPAVFVVFFCWFVANIFVAALKLPGQEAFDELYYHALLMVPFMILGLLLAYRLGGGDRPVVLRLGAAMLLIQLSRAGGPGGRRTAGFDPRGMDLGQPHHRLPRSSGESRRGVRIHRGASRARRPGAHPAGAPEAAMEPVRAQFDLTVVVPCFNEEDNVVPAYEEIISELGPDQLELLFVDDGSTDSTLELIRRIAAVDSRVHYLSFTRNFGIEAALGAGYRYAGRP